MLIQMIRSWRSARQKKFLKELVFVREQINTATQEISGVEQEQRDLVRKIANVPEEVSPLDVHEVADSEGVDYNKKLIQRLQKQEKKLEAKLGHPRM